MAKRLLSLLLFFMYLIPSIGVSGSVHYCGGEVAAVVIIPTDEHPCACGPNEPMDGGCCQDEAFSFKIKDNHKSADAKVLVKGFDDVAFIQKVFSVTKFDAPLSDKKVAWRIKGKEPPDKKLFVLFESYLI